MKVEEMSLGEMMELVEECEKHLKFFSKTTKHQSEQLIAITKRLANMVLSIND